MHTMNNMSDMPSPTQSDMGSCCFTRDPSNCEMACNDSDDGDFFLGMLFLSTYVFLTMIFCCLVTSRYVWLKTKHDVATQTDTTCVHYHVVIEPDNLIDVVVTDPPFE